ncbi:hypothetical protein [Streptomyces sp. NPDC088794]|uniref:hypothetical protein n=1 Tax=Streptomyces sp. NPDC088794 TaxID=3365902 RepID=UPI0037F1763D
MSRTKPPWRQAGRPSPCCLTVPTRAHAPLLSSVLANGGAAVSLCRPGTVASGARLRASAVLLAALARAVILAEALDHVEAMQTAGAAISLHRPCSPRPPPTMPAPAATPASSTGGSP